jgi:predicted ATPase
MRAARPRLKEITLRGYKTIGELMDFAPGPLTVLIGPNGAGKSNFISFFNLLSWALTPPGQLQEHVAKLGGASSLLHDESTIRPYPVRHEVSVAASFR